MSHAQQIIDFSLDPDGKNRWILVGFVRAVNPALYSDPNPFAVQQYYSSGMGYCHACGHSPIVNHYIVQHPTKGQAFVGSECIGKVLGQTKDKAIKTIVNREIRNFANKKKLEVMLAQYEQFFKENPKLLSLTTGFYESRYVKYHGRCTKVLSEEKFAEVHQDCSKFMKEAHLTHNKGMLNAIYQYGCKYCKSDESANYDNWCEQNKNNSKYKCLCENDNVVVVGDLSEVKPIEGCENPKACWRYEPVNPEENGQDILNKVRQAYERNYKDISFIFTAIKNFNKWQIKRADKVYEGKVPVEIPIFKGRDLKTQPFTEVEEMDRAKVIQSGLGVKGLQSTPEGV